MSNQNLLYHLMNGSSISGESTYDIYRATVKEDGSYQEFLEFLSGKDGTSISNIETIEGDEYNTVVITLTDNTTKEFTVKNGTGSGGTGADGKGGKSAYEVMVRNRR